MNHKIKQRQEKNQGKKSEEKHTHARTEIIVSLSQDSAIQSVPFFRTIQCVSYMVTSVIVPTGHRDKEKKRSSNQEKI